MELFLLDVFFFCFVNNVKTLDCDVDLLACFRSPEQFAYIFDILNFDPFVIKLVYLF